MKTTRDRLQPEQTPEQITVTFTDGNWRTCPVFTQVGDLLDAAPPPGPFACLGALVNNEVVSLSYPLEVDCRVQFLTLADSHGWRLYRQTVAFVMAKAVADLYPGGRLAVEHSLGNGFYCTFEQDGQPAVTPGFLQALEDRMRALVAAREPLRRRKMFYLDALKHFEDRGLADKCNLLRFQNPPKVDVNECDGFIDLAHDPLAADTGAVPLFQLIPHPPGFVLQLPDREVPGALPPFEPQPHLFEIFESYKKWGRVVGVRTVGDLNELIARGEFAAFVRIAEAYQEKRIARIADQIHERLGQVRWIFIAGPSSSGKTTFTKRLAVQLRVNGMDPVMISVDDYFVARGKTPLDELGQPDFEHIETIDLPLLHQHLEILDQGGEVEMPRFNFHLGQRIFKGDRLKLRPDQIMLVEGIHSLNPRLRGNLPESHVFRIYLSALTQLNLDFSNRISTTDNRLIRRMVRDHRFRGNPALATLEMWPSVRRGEKTWIFPYQNQADVAFNSALDYEVAILRPHIEPLLARIKPDQAQYVNARRLWRWLHNFLPAAATAVPPNSLLREFIGESGFNY